MFILIFLVVISLMLHFFYCYKLFVTPPMIISILYCTFLFLQFFFVVTPLFNASCYYTWYLLLHLKPMVYLALFDYEIFVCVALLRTPSTPNHFGKFIFI
jgi:hypothetical protein